MITSHPRRRVGVLSWTAAAVAILSVPVSRAQPAPADQAVCFGAWTLNRELSSKPRSPDAGRGARGRPGGTGRGGFGRPGDRGGGAPPSGQSQQKGTMELLQELMTPSAHLIITPAEDGAIRFTEADGLTRAYVLDEKKEKHQFVSGTFDTKTKWEDGELHQEVFATERMKIVRTYRVTPEPRQLIVTTTMDGGPDGQREPIRFVYDADPDS